MSACGKTIPAVLALLMVPLPPAGRDFRLGPILAPPGSVRSGSLAVDDPAGGGTFIPVTVIHGAAEGKVLALVAGTHGAEYPPILALQRLKQTLDPRGLSGTVILVHIANLPSFQKRTVYYNPRDGKNLNRVFPGDSRGTLSERIARVLTDQVIRRADALIDLHCGDANEALMPYTYWMVSGSEDVNAASKAMALAFGVSPIIIDTTRETDLRRSKYLANTAILLGKPAITTEAGQLGRSDEESVEINLRGVRSVMRGLGLLAGRPQTAENPVWIDRYEVVSAARDGLFFPRVGLGARVAAGESVGVIRDYWGDRAEEVRAPFAGLILYIIGTPPANRGEPLFEVGRIRGR